MGAPLLSRRPLRALAILSLAFAFGCQPGPTGPGVPEEGPLRIRPVLVSSFDPTTLDLDSIAVVISRSSDRSVIHEAVLAFESDAVLAWVLSLTDLPDVLDVHAEVRTGTVPMFEGEVQDIDIVAASAASETPVYEVELHFVGPGHDAATVEVSPEDAVLMFGQTVRFHATVRNAAGDVIPDPLLEWETSAPSLAAIDADGDLTAPSVRGNVRVRARTGNGVSGSTGVRFQPVVSTLNVLEGNGVSAPVAQRVTVKVQVVGSDGLGVEGVDVSFAAPPGATVSAGTVPTDGDGVAVTQATLGTLAGPYVFRASVAGPSPASITITAQPGSPAALVVDIDGSTSEPASPLAPGVSVRVVDAYGNLTAGAMPVSVSLGTNPTDAVLSGTTQVTAQSGQATFTNLVLDRHGSGFTLVASAAGLSGSSGAFDVVQIPRSVSVMPPFRQVNALGSMGAAFAAVALDAVGTPIVGQRFAWSSNNMAVATVDSMGVGTALANGLVNVRATAGTVTGSALVMIQQQPHSVVVTPGSKQLVSIGEQVALSASVVDANGFPIAGPTVTWSSSASAFVTVDGSGLATAVQNGGAQIDATSGSVSGSATLTVQQVATSVAVTPGTGSLSALQQQLQLAAEARDANGYLVAGATFAWSSDDGTIASVGTTGLVTALANGGTRVRATSGGASGSADVTVAQTVAAVTVDPPSNTLTALAAQVQLTATAADANGYAVAGAAFTWSSDAGGVASVSASGLVTAEANGSATITAAVGGIGASADVLVSQVPTDVVVTPASVLLNALGATATFGATVVDANGFAVPGRTVTWSAPAGAATVNGTGTVTAVANGSTIVTATSGTLSGAAGVTVAQRVATLTLAVSCPGSGAGGAPAAVSGPHTSILPGSCDTLTAFGDEALVTAEARDANGFIIANAAIVWTSLAPAVATVDQAGAVIAVGNGTAVIEAESDGVVAQVQIVVDQAVVLLDVRPEQLHLALGQQGQVTAVARDANGFEVAGVPISWEASAGLSVDASGLVTALAPGTGFVWATYLAFGGYSTVTVD